MRFLLDENLSHETASFLSDLGHDVKVVDDFGLSGASDLKVGEKALKERRIIVTHDLDFGDIFYFSNKRKLGVVVLRLKNQTVESVNYNLAKVLKARLLERIVVGGGLMVVEEDKIRIRRK